MARRRRRFFFQTAPLALGFADNASLDFLNGILGQNDLETDKSLQRLSGGRILLTDDPASYAIDQTLEKYVRGLDRTVLNQRDMISYYTVLDSYLAEVVDILQRIRELALQMTDGILSDKDAKFDRLDTVDSLLDDFIRERAYAGAKMKGLELATTGEQIASENMTRARTRQDTDFAVESANFKHRQLLLLVNVLMLAHETRR